MTIQEFINLFPENTLFTCDKAHNYWSYYPEDGAIAVVSLSVNGQGSTWYAPSKGHNSVPGYFQFLDEMADRIAKYRVEQGNHYALIPRKVLLPEAN